MSMRLAHRPFWAPIRDRRGVSAAEYAVLAVGVVVVVGSAVTFLNDPVSGVFQAAGNALTTTLNALRASGSASLASDAASIMAGSVAAPGGLHVI